MPTVLLQDLPPTARSLMEPCKVYVFVPFVAAKMILRKSKMKAPLRRTNCTGDAILVSSTSAEIQGS